MLPKHNTENGSLDNTCFYFIFVFVTRMSLAAVEGLEAVVGCEQGRWPEFIQVQKNGPYGGKNE